MLYNVSRIAVHNSTAGVRYGHQPEVRHIYNDYHIAQHDDDGYRALRASRRPRERSLRHQSDLHHRLHA